MMVLTAPHVLIKDLYDNDFIKKAENIKITNRQVNYYKREYEKLKSVHNY